MEQGSETGNLADFAFIGHAAVFAKLASHTSGVLTSVASMNFFKVTFQW